MPVGSDINRTLYQVDDHLHHNKAFTGNVYYVKTDGNNSALLDGKDPDTAWQTITYALTRVVAGDAITVKAGRYDEAGLTIALAGLELWCEIGVEILNTVDADPVIVVSADHCRISGPELEQAGVTGIRVTGDHCALETVHAVGSTIAFDIDGDGNHLIDCHDFDATTTGFDISGGKNYLCRCTTIAAGGASRGFYLSAATADENMLCDCVSTGNGTAGYEVVAGAAYNVFKDCSSGGGDGQRIDLGSRTQWANFTDQLPREHHEHVYPKSDGEGAAGAAITVTNSANNNTDAASTDQDFWGEPKIMMPINTETAIWRLIGINVYGNTTNKELLATLHRINTGVTSARNAGNVWDEGETALTVVDGSRFLADDLVWVYSSGHTDGEIVKVSSVVGNVVTIARETVDGGFANATGLRWDHSTDGSGEALYLVYRATLDGMHGIDFNFSCASAKAFFAYRFHEAKELKANDGILIRILNQSDGVAADFDATIIYED